MPEPTRPDDNDVADQLARYGAALEGSVDPVDVPGDDTVSSTGASAAGRARLEWFVAAAVVLLVAAVGLVVLRRDDGGTGVASGVPTVEDLTGTEWYSTQVLEDGLPKELPAIDGQPRQLSFTVNDAGQLWLGGGCNGISAASWFIEDGRLVAEEAMSTAMACLEPGLMEIDTWQQELLSASPTIRLDGDTLTLATETASITYRPAVEPEPLPLIGPTWVVESITDGQTVTASVGGTPIRVTFSADGRYEVESCPWFGATFEQDGDSLVLGEPEISDAFDCTWDQPWLATEVFDAGSTDVEIEGDLLHLRRGSGGLDLRAETWNTGTSPTSMTQTPDAAEQPDLAGTNWHLQRIETNGEVIDTEPLPLDVHDTDLTVGTGCNPIDADVTIANDTLVLTEAKWTARLCDDETMRREELIGAVLRNGSSTYERTDGELTITRGDVSLVYGLES